MIFQIDCEATINIVAEKFVRLALKPTSLIPGTETHETKKIFHKVCNPPLKLGTVSIVDAGAAYHMTIITIHNYNNFIPTPPSNTQEPAMPLVNTMSTRE